MGNYINPSDIDTWPSGCDAACQEDAINFVEELMEKILGRHFYSKAFDLEMNGNGKNRIFPPLHAPILTVARVDVCAIELNETWYDYDADSVYLDLCHSGVVLSEKYYFLTEAEPEGIFPRGYNNIRIIGTYGSAATPQPIIEAAKELVDAVNAGTFGKLGAFKSEKMGRYSYTLGVTGYSKDGIYTGIPKVDMILRHYKKQRKTIILTP